MLRTRTLRPALLLTSLAIALCGCPGNPNEPGNQSLTPIGGGSIGGPAGPIMEQSADSSPVESRYGGAPSTVGAPSTGVANPADPARGVTPAG